MQSNRRNLTSHATRLLPVTLGFIGAILVPNCRAFGSVITTVETIVLTGTVTQTIETKMATGQATVTPPGGPAMTQNMPTGGGKISVVVPGFAFAGATVDLNNQRKSHAWGYLSNSGFTANSSADIHKMKAVTSVTTSQIIQRVTTRLDPNEIISSYFAPNVNGNIGFDFSLVDNTSGMTLFNSITTLTSSSPDVIHDSTGMLTWTRVPGFFGGDDGDLGGLPNQLSNSRWMLDPFSLTFDIPITLNPGDTYMQNIAALLSSSGSVLAGSTGVIGISDTTIPEPSTYLTFGTGLLALVGYGWMRKRTGVDLS